MTPRRRRRLLLPGFVLLTLAACAVGVWWWTRPAPRPEPPLPQNITDAEVRRAVERGRQAVLDAPSSADAWGRFGMTLLANLFAEEADRCFAEAARLDPGDPRWPYARGVIALKKDPRNALSLLQQAVADAPPTDRASAMRMQYAEALLERGRLDEAEELFRKEGVENPRAALGLGLIALARGEREKAAEFLKTARESPFARKKATAQLAALARASGDEKTAARLERGMASLPDDPPWPDPFLDDVMRLRVGYRRWERVVGELEDQGRYEEAARLYLLQAKEDPARAYVGAAVNLARMGQYEEALRLLREAVQVEPDHANAHYTLALVQFTRAEKEKARSPGSGKTEEWFREVIPHARRATELKPGHAAAYLFWGLSLRHLGKPEEAIPPLRKAVAARPEKLDYQLALGEALLEAGRPDEANEYLQNARRLDPDDPRPAQALERLRAKKDPESRPPAPDR